MNWESEAERRAEAVSKLYIIVALRRILGRATSRRQRYALEQQLFQFPGIELCIMVESADV